MTNDIKGCSTCQTGEERFESFNGWDGHSLRNRIQMFQYDFRDTDGELFSCVRTTVEKCREARNGWLKLKNIHNQKAGKGPSDPFDLDDFFKR
jgi:hypothetical protein